MSNWNKGKKGQSTLWDTTRKGATIMFPNWHDSHTKLDNLDKLLQFGHGNLIEHEGELKTP